MSLKTALYAAKANGCTMMAIPNPECWDEGDDEWDVPPTGDIKKILAWMGESDNIPNILFFDKKGVKLGHWCIYWDEDGVDWLQDCDVGEWTNTVTEGQY